MYRVVTPGEEWLEASSSLGWIERTVAQGRDLVAGRLKLLVGAHAEPVGATERDAWAAYYASEQGPSIDDLSWPPL